MFQSVASSVTLQLIFVEKKTKPTDIMETIIPPKNIKMEPVELTEPVNIKTEPVELMEATNMSEEIDVNLSEFKESIITIKNEPLEFTELNFTFEENNKETEDTTLTNPTTNNIKLNEFIEPIRTEIQEPITNSAGNKTESTKVIPEEPSEEIENTDIIKPYIPPEVEILDIDFFDMEDPIDEESQTNSIPPEVEILGIDFFDEEYSPDIQQLAENTDLNESIATTDLNEPIATTTQVKTESEEPGLLLHPITFSRKVKHIKKEIKQVN